MLRSFPAVGEVDEDLQREGYILAVFNGQEAVPVILENPGEIGTIRISTLRTAIAPNTRNFNLVSVVGSRQVSNPLSVVNDVTVYGFHAGYTYTFSAGADTVLDLPPAAAQAQSAFSLPENTPEFVKNMVPGRNPLCKTLSGTIIGIANFLFLLLGLILAGVSGFGMQQSGNISQVIPIGAIKLGLAAGILLCFVAILGFAGVWLSHHTIGQKMLTLYALLMSLLFLLVLIAGGILVGAANHLDTNNVTVNDFVNSTYYTCCDPVTKARLPDCWVPAPDCVSVETFRGDIVIWIQRQLAPMGGTLIFLAVLLFLTIIGSCFVTKIGKRQMMQRIQDLASPLTRAAGLGGSKKPSAPYANMA